MRSVNDRLVMDSAGTGGWHVGDPPDPRAIETASNYNIDISKQTCRRLMASDFHEFDFILAMDNSNITNAKAANHSNGPAKLMLFTRFAGLGENIEIPDPYFGEGQGFETAYQMIRQASIGSLDHLFGAHRET